MKYPIVTQAEARAQKPEAEAQGGGVPIGIIREQGEGGFWGQVVFQDYTVPWRYAFIRCYRMYDQSSYQPDICTHTANRSKQVQGQPIGRNSGSPFVSCDGEQSSFNTGNGPFKQAVTEDNSILTLTEGMTLNWAEEINHLQSVPIGSYVWIRGGETYTELITKTMRMDYTFTWNQPIWAQIIGGHKVSQGDKSNDHQYQWQEFNRKKSFGSEGTVRWQLATSWRSSICGDQIIEPGEVVTGTLKYPAREINGNTTVPMGTYVQLYPGQALAYNDDGTISDQEYLFAYQSASYQNFELYDDLTSKSANTVKAYPIKPTGERTSETTGDVHIPDGFPTYSIGEKTGIARASGAPSGHQTARGATGLARLNASNEWEIVWVQRKAQIIKVSVAGSVPIAAAATFTSATCEVMDQGQDPSFGSGALTLIQNGPQAIPANSTGIICIWDTSLNTYLAISNGAVIAWGIVQTTPTNQSGATALAVSVKACNADGSSPAGSAFNVYTPILSARDTALFAGDVVGFTSSTGANAFTIVTDCFDDPMDTLRLLYTNAARVPNGWTELSSTLNGKFPLFSNGTAGTLTGSNTHTHGLTLSCLFAVTGASAAVIGSTTGSTTAPNPPNVTVRVIQRTS